MKRVASLLMLALIGAGCSDSTQSTTKRAPAVTFSECMRQHGVKGFPDPEASGELTIDGVLNGSSLDPDSAAWKQAISACKDLQPPGFTGRKATPKEQNVRLKFAQCIRDNGVKDFPDPANGDPLVDTNRIPSSATDEGMSTLNAAMRTCGDVFEDKLGLR